MSADLRIWQPRKNLRVKSHRRFSPPELSDVFLFGLSSHQWPTTLVVVLRLDRYLSELHKAVRRFNENGKKMEGMGDLGQTVGGCARTEKVCIDPGVMMD